MPHATWYSEPNRDMPSFGNFDPSMIADDDTRFVLERIREELAQLGRGCEKPLYGLRAHCWMPDVGRVKYGYYMAQFNETVLSAKSVENGIIKRTVVLPDAVLRPGGSVEVIDRMGDAATTNITIKTIKGQTVNRASTYTVNTNSAGVVFRSDGENWWAISSSPGGSTGAGNVSSTSAFTADNRLTKTDRPTSNNRNIQQTGITVDDSDNVDFNGGDLSNINNLQADVIGARVIAATEEMSTPVLTTDEIRFPQGAADIVIGIGPNGGLGFFNALGTLIMEVGTGGANEDVDVKGKLNVDGDVDPESITLEVVDGIQRPSVRRVPVFKRDASGKYIRDPKTKRAVVDHVIEKPVASLYFRTDGKPCIHINGKTLVLAVEAVE